ncbi:23S rRNA (uracil(1939)-C(5))-methyltransferase RlmD [Pseudidiomarina sediminum]|uniref:23S rRNA (Uracil(1939)-C(5))-methyltransferase RlmD n=1 Tax=Pseudidiomarina sediminum TaxID=431675 RepID=A0A432Z817_9GAMM|nr:23S rRNA (uracil(1939)-C(5))-methyltransferase RlmD [Pseudidiomarina sediminum]RUO74029.1 23S rRNA (uracil(1939)-C(5))-methyltransferase RlmD [Pseudidiomarina sediminum]
MARFYRPQKHTPKAAVELAEQRVVGLDHQGRGVVRTPKGVRFVAGALPDEVIRMRLQGKYDAQLLAVTTPAPTRQTPACPYYERCGGCDMQHYALEAQREHKQRVVHELLQKFAQLAPQQWLAPLTADAWRYRRRLRLACHWDSKRQRFTLGLREAQSKRIVAVDDCLVASTTLTELLAPLRTLLPQLDLVRELGHVELLQTEQRIVVLRLGQWPSADDVQQLLNFAQQQQLQVWLHCGTQAPQPLLAEGETAVVPHYQSADVSLAFQPGDFLQAHGALNPMMVAQALEWLALTPGEQVLELYAGSGNFTLPMARQGAQVTAIEGVASMVERLQQNAQAQNVSVRGYHADLEQPWQDYAWAQTGYSKVLLDPARAGAAHAITEVVKLQPQRVVYVSCAPDTLARDAAVLAAHGYVLKQAQVIDMFPQTHHIECLTWFEREA